MVGALVEDHLGEEDVPEARHVDHVAEGVFGVASANLCHLANISYRLKRSLAFDPAAGKFKDEEANRMMTRSAYRAPYIVSQTV